MGTKTGIEWTDATWNPVRGCSRVSEGCRNCYAESRAQRFSGPGGPYEGLVRIGADGKRRAEWNGAVRFVEEHLLDPLKWKKPRRIFVNSMSDLFHEGVTDEQLDRIFAVMWACEYLGKRDNVVEGHIFQILTKRPERMLDYMSRDHRAAWAKHAVHFGGGDSPDILYDQVALATHEHPRIWLGVSVEDQNAADERISLLFQTPAAVRFISCEPLLGAIDLTVLSRNPDVFDVSLEGFHMCKGFYFDALAGSNGVLMKDGKCHEECVGARAKLDWVICGGESGKGPGIRPTHPDWVRGLRDQCVSAGVPFFFKQWGEWLPFNQRESGQISNSVSYDLLLPGSAGTWFVGKNAKSVSDDLLKTRSEGWWRVGKKAAGHLLDGKEWRQFPAAGRDGVGADGTFCNKLTERTDQYVAGPAR